MERTYFWSKDFTHYDLNLEQAFISMFPNPIPKYPLSCKCLPFNSLLLHDPIICCTYSCQTDLKELK